MHLAAHLVWALNTQAAQSYPNFQGCCSHINGDGGAVTEASSKEESVCSLTSGLHSGCISAGKLDRIGPLMPWSS